MNDRLLQAATLFMTQLEVVQDELSELMAEKRTAMTQIQGNDLARISADENVLITRLQKLLRERNRILEFAQQRDLPSQSLLHLVKAIAQETRDELVERISLIDELLALVESPDVDEAPEPPRLTFQDVEVAVLAILGGRLLTPREIHKAVIAHLGRNGLATREITRVLESLVKAGKVSHIGRGLHELA